MEHIYFVEIDFHTKAPVMETERVVKRTERTVSTEAGSHWTRRRDVSGCDFTPADAWARFIQTEALGVLPDGYCFCPIGRHAADGGHTGECSDARAALRKRE